MPVSRLPVSSSEWSPDRPASRASPDVLEIKVVGDTTATVAVLRFSPADPAAITTCQPAAHKSQSERSHPARCEETVKEQRRHRK